MKIQAFSLSALLFSGLLVAAGSEEAAPKDDAFQKGQLLYETCKTCHGAKGEGNPLIEAPSITGLPKWYVISTLTKFKEGIRGAHADDVRGLQMRPMARALKDKAEIDAVASVVASLPIHPPEETLQGDPEKGKPLYATCMACHGPKGEGNLALKAPPVAQLPDWYVVAQLKKFKAGIRGVHPKDVEGQQMRPMAMILADEKAMVDLAAYIRTLGNFSSANSAQ